MSLYSEYILEREGKECLETEHGFITFKINKPECYIIDVYVTPALRRTRLASELADKVSDIARKVGCTYLAGSVAPAAQGATESLQTLLSYGFRLAKSTDQLIYFVKSLEK